jgi:kinesin family protein 5
LSLKEEDVDLLEELFVQEGIIFDPDTAVLDIDTACHDAVSQQIALLVEAVGELTETVQEVIYSTNQTCIHPPVAILLSPRW